MAVKQQIIRVASDSEVIFLHLYEGDRIVNDEDDASYIIPNNESFGGNMTLRMGLAEGLIIEDGGVGTGTGPRGVKGLQGDDGLKGDKGDDGLDGRDGSD